MEPYSEEPNGIESINHELLHFLHNRICFDTRYHPIDTGEKAKETLLKNDPWATLKSSIALRNVLLINLNWSDSWYPINLSKINLMQNRSDSRRLDCRWSNIIWVTYNKSNKMGFCNREPDYCLLHEFMDYRRVNEYIASLYGKTDLQILLWTYLLYISYTKVGLFFAALFRQKLICHLKAT